MIFNNKAMQSIGTFLLLVAGNSFAGGHAKVKATIKGSGGENHGVVEFYGVPGGVLMDAQLKGLPPGEHAFHIHAKGSCTPDFKAAGGHLIRRVSNMGSVWLRVQTRIFMYQIMARFG